MKKFFVFALVFTGVALIGCDNAESPASMDNRLKITSATISDGQMTLPIMSSNAVFASNATACSLSVSEESGDPTSSSDAVSTSTGDGVYAEYVTWETWCFSEKRDSEHSWDDLITMGPDATNPVYSSYKSYDYKTPVTSASIFDINIKGLADTIFGRFKYDFDTTTTLSDGTKILVPAGTYVYNGLPCTDYTIDGVTSEYHPLAIRATLHFTDGSTARYVKLIEYPAESTDDTLYQFFNIPVGSSLVQDIALILSIEIDASLIKPQE